MTAAWKVALVEDDAALARSLARALTAEGFLARVAPTAIDGERLICAWQPDAVLVDLTLPDSDGPWLLRRYRDLTETALIGLTARSGLADVVAGFESGADDYIIKPVHVEVLVARLTAVLRRTRARSAPVMRFSDLELDLGQARAHRAGRDLELTATELRLLAELMRRGGQVVPRAELTSALWARPARPESNSLEVHMFRLREKTERASERRLIRTVRGIGYALKEGE